MKIIVAITGASGVIYGVRTLQILRGLGVESHLIISDGGKLTMGHELAVSVKAIAEMADVVYSDRDLGASISSGSFRTDGMLISPCSIKTLSAVANGSSSSLIARAADVVLKERRRLVMLLRETPLHAGHIELMGRATNSGAIIMPPVPAFYYRPTTLEDVIDHTVGRSLDLFGLSSGSVARWTEEKEEGSRSRTSPYYSRLVSGEASM